MRKVTLTVPWGQCDPIVKKIEYKHSLLQCSFPPNNISKTGLYSNINIRHDFVLGTFEYIEADGEIYRKFITKCI